MFARAVIENMGRSTNMNENPDRNAAFQVLKTAKVPAVLIELAYVTNRADAAQLRSESWRGNVARSIRSAIDNYFSHQAARLPF
jgi:N-acetylmuramoyl-L-alanine amidase